MPHTSLSTGGLVIKAVDKIPDDNSLQSQTTHKTSKLDNI